MIYDTLKLSKALRVSFTPEQSETLARAFSDSTEDNVATKRDMAELKAEIAGVRGEMVELRAEVKTEIAAVRGEIAELRAETKTEIAGVRGEIAKLRAETKTEIAGVRGEIAELRAETKTEIAGVRGEIAELRAEMKTEIAALKVDMVRWIVGAIAFNLLGTMGLMITVAYLVAKSIK